MSAPLPPLPLHYCRPGPVAEGMTKTIRDLGPFNRMAGIGVPFFQINATASANLYDDSPDVWLAPGHYDYATQEAGWRRVLADKPDTKLCLRIFLGSPQWWDDANPDELQRSADGSTRFNLRHTPRQTVPSVASEKWRAAHADCLCRFLEWLKTSGWSERIWGFLVCAGITYEWGLFGAEDFPDTSTPMLRRFRAYLSETYADESALRSAWNDATVTFATAEIPSRTAREAGEGNLRVFPRDRAAYDFQRCLSVANAEWLVDSCRILRTHGEAHYQIGTFYGYTLTAREGTGPSTRVGAGGFTGGQHALAQVLRANVLDYIASPYAYGERDLGIGTLVPHFPWSSVRHHGVRCYLENDVWAFTNPRGKNDFMSVGQTTTREDSLLHQRLAFATALCRDESLWWFDITDSQKNGIEVSNYSDPAIHDELTRQFTAFNRLAAHRGNDTAQIALVIDEVGKDALKLDSKLFLNEVYHAMETWSWCGAPFDVWLSSDVTAETMARYRLVYLFAPALPAAEQTRLRDDLVSPDRTLWLAPGTELAGAPAALRQPCADLTPQDLASIAARAGVHLYGTAPLQVWASENLVTVHTRDAGTRRLSFPGTGPWREVFDGSPVADSFDFTRHDVRLFERLPAS